MKLFFTLLFFFSLLHTASAKIYYFSASGDDSRTATQAQSQATPWKTIAKLNSVFSILQPGDYVLFKRGETFYGSIKITKSGTSGSPITIGAYGSGAKPVITGFLTLSKWVSIGGGKYESYNPALGATVNMVALNGVAKEMGRYPNSNAADKGYLYFESHGTNSITDKELSSSPDWTGAEVVIRSHHWVLDRRTVTDQSGSTIKYSPATTYTPKNGYGYFLQNSIKTLDQMSEWFYKPSTKKLTMYFGTNTPSNYTVQASGVKDLVYINNYDYTIFDNLCFKGANENIFDIYSSNSTRIINCDILLAGIDGIWAQNTNYLSVENCTISNTNNNGIFLYSNTNSSVIRNNVINKSGMLAGMGLSGDNQNNGIRANGDKNLIEYNTIDSSGYCGIRFTGDYTIIKNNLITYFNLVKDDGGGIYTSNGGGPERVGRKVIGNVILNGIGAREGTPNKVVQQSSGIYLDNNSSGITIADNTIANCGKAGLYIHNSFKIHISGNTVYNNTAQSLLNHDNAEFPTLTNVTLKNNIFFSKRADQPVAYFYTRLNDIAKFGKIDSNYYLRPLDENSIILGITGLYTGSTQVRTWYTLDTWKPKYYHDPKSRKSPKILASTANPDDYIRFYYNASKSSKTIALSGSYVDAKNKSYSESITLAPYSSAVLIKTENATTENATATATTYAVPGKVEAENYSSMTGVHKQTTTDAGSGQNVGYIDLNDWMNYSIKAAAAGTYNVTFRVASRATGAQFQVRNSSGTVLATVNVPNTGGWQTWKNVNALVKLPGGTQTLRLYSTHSARWNINYMNFATLTTTSTAVSNNTVSTSTFSEAPDNVFIKPVQSSVDFRLFPNPVNNKLFVEFKGLQVNEQRVNMIIQNSAGSTIKNMIINLAGTGTAVDVSSLRAGMYILTLANKNFTVSKKFLKTN